MKRGLRNNLILISLLAGLIGWYFLYEKKYKVTQEESEERSKQLVSLTKEDVQFLEITRPVGDTKDSRIALKKVGAEWELTYPISDRADGSTVVSMVSALVTTKYERVVDEAAGDLKPFGLDKPVLKVRVKKSEADAGEEILFGKDTPVGTGVYAQISGATKVYRMPQHVAKTLKKEVAELRNRTIVGLSRFDMAEVEVKNAQGEVVLKKDDSDRWTLVRESLPADTGEVNRLLGLISDLKAKNFASEKPAELSKYGLSPPAVQILVTKAKDPNRLTLLIGKGKDGKIYTKRGDRPVVYEVDKDIFEKSTKGAKDFRSLELATFNRFDVKRIRIEKPRDPKGTLEFLQEATGWTFPTSPNVRLDSSKVESFLTKIQDARIERYGQKGETPQQSVLSVRLFEKRDDKETEKVVLEFGAVAKGQSFVKRQGLDLPLVVKKDVFEKLNLSLKDFEKTEEKADTKSKG